MRRQPAGRTPTSKQQPCSGTQPAALATQEPLDLPHNTVEFTCVMEMLTKPPTPRPPAKELWAVARVHKRRSAQKAQEEDGLVGGAQDHRCLSVTEDETRRCPWTGHSRGKRRRCSRKSSTAARQQPPDLPVHEGAHKQTDRTTATPPPTHPRTRPTTTLAGLGGGGGYRAAPSGAVNKNGV